MTTNHHGWSSATTDHGHTCPTCGHDAAALLMEIERLRLRLRTLERYAVDPWPETGTTADRGVMIVLTGPV